MTWRKCVYCGRQCKTRKGAGWTCHAHQDLPALDPYYTRCYDNTMPLQVSEDMAATREKGA